MPAPTVPQRPVPASKTAPPPVSQSAIAPVGDTTAKPAAALAAAAKPARTPDESLPIAGGVLALLALGGAAYAVSRRRRRQDEWHGDWADDPKMEHHEAAARAALEPRHDPVLHDEQPQIIAPSAFAWGATAPRKEHGDDSGDDRLPGETWIERAYRGPSANNPSVSLKNRLRRAAFFDKRERDVAAGLAEPVDPDAGLPDAMAEAQERELA